MTIRQVKTYSNWQGSLNQYLKVGDLTDEEMYQYFIDVIPTATMRSDCVQLGEPYSHVNGKPTFATLKQVDEGLWMFCGYCYKGQNTEPIEKA